MKTEIRTLLCFILMFLRFAAVAQPSEQWGRLEAGPYAVGYRVVLRSDYSRTFDVQTNHHEKSNPDDHIRPLQLSIWYPAQKSDSSVHMAYKEYVGWVGLIGKRHQMNEETRNAGISEFTKYFIAQGVEKQKIEQLMRMTTAVEKNATAERGPFPLILFAPGIGESPVMHTIMCEYLASHGYVVAALPSMGWTSRDMDFTGACIETQVRDLEGTIAILRENPSIDMRRTGIVGFSFGSCASLILSMRNADIDAVVSLDGSIGFRDRIGLVKASPFFDPANVKIPFLHINIKGNKRNDLSIIDSMKNSMRYIVGIRGISHVNFTSLGMMAGIMPGFWKSIEENAKIAYESICRYTLDFLDAYVKDGKKPPAFIAEVPRSYIMPPGFASVRIEKPRPAQTR